jgi:hypothetical protein
VWKHTQLILDVGEGAPEGFSLPAGEDAHFVIRSRVFGPRERVAEVNTANGQIERTVTRVPRGAAPAGERTTASTADGYLGPKAPTGSWLPSIPSKGDPMASA